MISLEQYFNNNTGRLIHKYQHYFDIYERHFQKYRNKKVVILEIGIFQGGSLQMWKKYFGNKAVIYGIDINPKCKAFEEKNINIFIGSQSDRKFLRYVKRQIPKVDILIDDGGHFMKQQIITFEEMYDHVNEDGIYLAEDLHTSYWLRYGGGNRRMGTFIEYSKKLIDSLNAYHSEQRSLKVSEFTKSTYALHYYDSMLVVEKTPRKPPVDSSTGNLSYPVETAPRHFSYVVRIGLLHVVDFVLRLFRLPGLMR
ncbi:MAG: hypothetical protein U1F16_04755 [Turneriella sp.]